MKQKTTNPLIPPMFQITIVRWRWKWGEVWR